MRVDCGRASDAALMSWGRRRRRKPSGSRDHWLRGRRRDEAPVLAALRVDERLNLRRQRAGDFPAVQVAPFIPYAIP